MAKAIARIPAPRSEAEARLEQHFQLYGVTGWVSEYRFDSKRRWRFDFAWPELRFAVEVEGITKEGGRHQRPAGFEADLEKYEAAMLQECTVYRCSPTMVKSLRAVSVIKAMVAHLVKANHQ